MRLVRVQVRRVCGGSIIPHTAGPALRQPAGGLEVPYLRCSEELLSEQECGDRRVRPEPAVRAGNEHADLWPEGPAHLRQPPLLLRSLLVWIFLAMTM